MFETKIKIKFSDCDAAGRIFFARIFDYAHSVFEEFILTHLTNIRFFNSEEFLVPITKASAKFLKQISLHDDILAKLFVTIREHSFSIKIQFVHSETVAAEVETVHVFVNKHNGQKMIIPENIRNVLLNFVK